MHLNTRFSAHLMLRVGPRGSMQQCPPASPKPDRWRVAALEASAWFSFPAQRTVGVMTERENLATGPSARVTELALTTFFSRSYSRDIPSFRPVDWTCPSTFDAGPADLIALLAVDVDIPVAPAMAGGDPCGCREPHPCRSPGTLSVAGMASRLGLPPSKGFTPRPGAQPILRS